MSPSSNQVAAPSEAGHDHQHRQLRPVILIFILLVAVAGYFTWRYLNPGSDPHRLQISGRLEGYETNLSPKIGGRVDFVGPREGDRVTAGQVVSRLSDADYQAQLRGATARIEKAQHQVQQKTQQLAVLEAQISGARKRLAQSREETVAQVSQATENLHEEQARFKQAESELTQAKSQLDLSAIRLSRYTNLVKKGAVTKDEYDQARTTYNNDLATVSAREASLQAAERSVLAARAGLKQQQASRYTPPIRSSDVDVFEAQRQQARQEIEAAKKDVANAIAERDQIAANIAYLTITSPINGVVTARPVEPGAVLSPGQTILTVLDYSKVYMRAYVPDGKIGAIRVDQKARVFLDSAPNKPLTGHVGAIDPEASFTPENIYFKDDRVKQVFGIKINIDEPGGLAKPGMPADAQLEI